MSFPRGSFAFTLPCDATGGFGGGGLDAGGGGLDALVLSDVIVSVLTKNNRKR